jgi:hypothetical protein
MNRTLTANGEVGKDHIRKVEMPEDVPVGPARVTVTIETEIKEPIRTLGDLLDSGFVGMYADRTDLQTTPEEFAAWRNKIWSTQDG